ncbi:MAG: hypothetical protein ACJAVZ_001636 [Afipia broomeae]|jgi:hypothetical protein
MPLHETARHQRRRDEITFLIMLYSNPSGLRWQLARPRVAALFVAQDRI